MVAYDTEEEDDDDAPPKMPSIMAPPSIWLATAVGHGMLVRAPNQTQGSRRARRSGAQPQQLDGTMVHATDEAKFRLVGEGRGQHLVQSSTKQPDEFDEQSANNDASRQQQRKKQQEEEPEELYDMATAQAAEEFEERHVARSRKAQGLLSSLGSGRTQTSIEIAHRFDTATIEVARNRICLSEQLEGVKVYVGKARAKKAWQLETSIWGAC